MENPMGKGTWGAIVRRVMKSWIWLKWLSMHPCTKTNRVNGLLLLLLNRFSRVRLCATPETTSHPAPPSLGFSRQEHWSGLPFPSLMHESKKWKWSRSVVSDSSRPRGLQPTRLLYPWDSLGKSTGVGCHCLLPVNGLAISNTRQVCVSFREGLLNKNAILIDKWV